MGRTYTLLTLGLSSMLLANFAAADQVQARKVAFGGFQRGVSNFRMLDAPIVEKRKAAAGVTRVSLSGSSIAAIGDRVAVVDGDSGKLVLATVEGKVLDTMTIHSNVGQLAADRRRGLVYVADRESDRLWVVAIEGDKLVHKRRVATPAEPFGVALTPDGSQVLVTTIADRKLVGYATDTMRQLWAVEIAREARGVAIRPDGREALITHLSTGTISHVTLRGTRAPTVIRHTALNRAGTSNNNARPVFANSNNANRAPRISNTPEGFAFARNAFAATHLPNGTAIVAYQTSTPQQVTNGRERVGTYGGGFQAPVEHRIAFIGSNGKVSRPIARAEISAHQPRALAYDARRDILYIAGLGNDRITAIASAADPGRYHAYTVSFPAGESRCGANGMDVTDSGEVVVFCSFRRAIARVKTAENLRTANIQMSKAMTRSKMSRAAHKGMELFHTGGDFRLSTRGAMACASCHPEGRNDGLSWRIEGHSLQTPLLLGGRLLGTHPFKWDGKDRNITTSLTNTVRRLGGTGITKKDAKNLQAFFKTLPRPRHKTIADHQAVKRGKKLFYSKTLGCRSCHAGSKYTDGKSYDLADDLGKVDTPSLIGLAASAPYYHDGSAADLRALVMEKGSVHGMGRLGKIKDNQIDDLIAFLETL